MSLADGMAAINLEMPPRVPHTEYSLERHWRVVRELTGYDIKPDSPSEIQQRASYELMHVLNYDFRWNILLHMQPFGDLRTTMGHAEYADDGYDKDTRIFSPFKAPEEVLRFDFQKAYGTPNRDEWKRRFEEDYQRRQKETPDLVNTTGIYITTISGMLEVFGWEMLLLAAGTDPEAFGALAGRYSEWIRPYFEALAEADVPVVMIHDDIVWTSGPIFSPSWYRKFLFPCYKKLFAPLLDAKKKVLFTSDGNYTAFIDDIAGSGVHGFVLEPTTDMVYLAEKYGDTHVFIGNADTRVLLNGTREQIRAEVNRCMTIGKPFAGYFMAVGNHIPANTPVENVLYYLDVYEELSKR